MGVIPMTADTCYIFLNSAEGDNPLIPENQLVATVEVFLTH